ncbi:unnamed protein product [Ceutorhynchus assimilis]|uniref:Uncharacterized protein n=1 Tax=Ceutorhynchus assimilis TaxID=467358 RepID=A0A9N9QF21_9CUCU|nr:unnamed protein product [Ceutorhynchus assimilis]
MAEWLKNQYDINFRSNIINVSMIKSFFKKTNDNSDANHILIEDCDYYGAKRTCISNNNRQKQSSVHTKAIVIFKNNINSNNDIKKNNVNIKFVENEKTVWRRLSLQSFKKRRQRKIEEKSKPMIPLVLRTYDKRGDVIVSRSNDECWY